VSSAASELRVLPVGGMPEVREGNRLGKLISARAALEEGDVVVVSQKAVSKAEGRVVSLAQVRPSVRAERLAAQLDRDPALVQLALDESREVLRAERGVLVCETRQGLVCANAGVDTSNVGEGLAVLLPTDPDGSARRIRAELREASGRSLAVIVSDSFGRAWRRGQCEIAVGCAGLRPLDDWRGRTDAGGRLLAATVIAIADEAAAAADLVRDKASGVPAAIVRGLGPHVSDGDGPGAAALCRPREQDLFR
jgi:coenzyme F420-0:L-glutamate ligase / coenzyme F420-1:gamma-L-glutamate ligase